VANAAKARHGTPMPSCTLDRWFTRQQTRLPACTCLRRCARHGGMRARGARAAPLLARAAPAPQLEPQSARAGRGPAALRSAGARAGMAMRSTSRMTGNQQRTAEQPSRAHEQPARARSHEDRPPVQVHSHAQPAPPPARARSQLRAQRPPPLPPAALALCAASRARLSPAGHGRARAAVAGAAARSSRATARIPRCLAPSAPHRQLRPREH
jgi:hypothetical protein